MPSQTRLLRKSYAMSRMGKAIERAIAAKTSKEKTRAAQWAAAWGLLCGITASSTPLRNDVVASEEERETSDQIEIPPMDISVESVAPLEAAEQIAIPPAFIIDQDSDEGTGEAPGLAAPH
jgi:hypothetical protein